MNRRAGILACTTLLAGAAVAFCVTSALAAPVRYEAENAPATCDGVIESNHAGFSGSGFCNANNAGLSCVLSLACSSVRNCRRRASSCVASVRRCASVRIAVIVVLHFQASSAPRCRGRTVIVRPTPGKGKRNRAQRA